VSLRDAIDLANRSLGPISIGFDPSLFATPKVIRLNGTELNLSGNTFGAITLAGPAAGVTISGNKQSDVMTIGRGVVARLSNINIADGGDINAGGPIFSTGGLFNNGDLTLTNSVISNNEGSFGGIINTGRAVITRSVISANQTQNQYGGGINNSGVLTLNQSTVSGNTAMYANGAGIYNDGVASINDSTISGNMAPVGLFGETFTYGRGGGIDNLGTITLTNSTVSGNSSDIRGAGIENLGIVTLDDSTVTDNSITVGDGAHPAGGGIDNVNGARLVIANTIVMAPSSRAHRSAEWRWTA
jgi:hypothetical protein